MNRFEIMKLGSTLITLLKIRLLTQFSLLIQTHVYVFDVQITIEKETFSIGFNNAIIKIADETIRTPVNSQLVRI